MFESCRAHSRVPPFACGAHDLQHGVLGNLLADVAEGPAGNGARHAPHDLSLPHKLVAGLGIFAKRTVLYGEDFWQILGLPLRVFVSGQDDNPQLFDGVLTPILIMFLPWTFKGKWLEEKIFFANFALLFLIYALFLVDMRIRYIISIVPALVILAVYGIFNVYLRIQRPGFLFAGFSRLRSLKMRIVRRPRWQGSSDSCRVLLGGLHHLQRDLHQCAHQQNNILLPRPAALEKR